MGRLNYTVTMSIDGYAADAEGDFQWSAPTDEVFQAHLDRMTEVSTEILGRRTYQLMRYWETPPVDEEWSADEVEFARRWQRADRFVASSTLTAADVAASRAELVPRLTLRETARIVEDAPGLVEIFGPTVAAEAILAGMVEEFRFFVVPKVVGGGLRALPDGIRMDMSLAEQRVFRDGTVLLRYVHG
ncbi:dihydrofolate reductase family protein [Microbacterium halotolerans]|uniref:dihydrofolate reductase family protein n=1 Tax=Microbacterium halotolerans TaxID=246613 RepID=UPI000E6ACF34|nr:dihydrofolate reductase family protein [Microbacterium halotolerans]